MKKLTAKQAAFVREYLVDLNATAAARRAGYSEKTADRIAHQNLRKLEVQAALQKALHARSERTEITADRVLQELARIGFADIRNLFTWNEERAAYVPSRELTDDQAAAIQAVKAKTTRFTREDGTEEKKIELELKTYDKQKALELMGKHLRLFVDRVEHTGAVEIEMVYDDDGEG